MPLLSKVKQWRGKCKTGHRSELNSEFTRHTGDRCHQKQQCESASLKQDLNCRSGHHSGTLLDLTVCTDTASIPVLTMADMSHILHNSIYKFNQTPHPYDQEREEQRTHSLLLTGSIISFFYGFIQDLNTYSWR